MRRIDIDDKALCVNSFRPDNEIESKENIQVKYIPSERILMDNKNLLNTLIKSRSTMD